MKTVRMLVILVLAMIVSLLANVTKADFTFGEPTNLGPTVNSSSMDFDSTVSPDGLSLYFSSERPGGNGGTDLWVTMRQTVSDPWEQPVNLGPTVNSSAWDSCPSISADGLSLYFESNRPGGIGDQDIWVTSRTTLDDDWGLPENLGSKVNSSAWDSCPSISADGLSLYFDSYRPGGSGSCDLWVTMRATASDPWEQPVNLGLTVNSAAWEYQPDISSDNLNLFFFSNRPGGSGSDDIWVTTRASTSDLWIEAVNLGQTVNSSARDICPYISANGSTLYFSSGRTGGVGNIDLWQVSINPIVDFNGDGIVDSADMDIMVDHWHMDEPACDIGPTPLGDGIVDAQDMLVLTEYLMKEKVDVDADIAAIEEHMDLYSLGLTTGDLDLWMSLYTEDTVKFAPDAPAVFGKEALRASMEPLFEAFTFEEMDIFDVEIQLTGDYAFARCNFTATMIPKGGGEPAYMDGKDISIMQRQPDGSWKLYWDCWNSNVPPAQ